MIDIENLQELCQNTMISHLGIEFTSIEPDCVQAKMPVDARTRQPMGIMHGGASAALAETVGSVGAALQLDLERQAPVGLELNANHIRPVREGYVYGTARPLHIGQRTQVWDIKIEDEAGQLVCTGRLTLMIVSVS